MRVYVHQFNGVATVNVLPLAAGLVVASAKMDPLVASVADFDIRIDRLPIEEVVESYDDPDVLAFSCYCWNDAYTHQVARRAKKRYPDCLVVLGGPNVPRRRERIAELMRSRPYIDMLVLGEGEVTFRELVRARIDNTPLEEVAGLVVRDRCEPDGVRVTRARDRIRDFSQTASPYLDGTFDALFERYSGQLTAAVFETNRGCPFSCTFCDWGQAIQSRVNELPIARVEQEFEWLGARNIPYLYIVDANFGIRPRDIDIVRHLATVKQRTGFPRYCHFHMTKNAQRKNLATVEALRDAGVGCQVALSMQDFDDQVLVAIKRDNISLEQSLGLRKACNERGIPTFNELILGLPAQTYSSFCASMVKAITPYPGDSFFLYLCRLLENAEMAEPAQRELYGIETRACLIGDFHRPVDRFHVDEREEIVVATRAMPNAEWRRAYRFGYLLGAFYNYRLLDVVIHYLRENLAVDLCCWIDAILDAMAEDSEGGVLGELERIFVRYVDAIMNSGGLVLERPGDSTRLWAVGDAVLATALARRSEFFEAVCRITHDVLDAPESRSLVDELFAFQSLLVPGFDRRRPTGATFSRDWIQYRRSMGGDASVQLPRSIPDGMTLVHTPPPHVVDAADWPDFLTRQLALLYARAPMDCVTPR